MSDILLGVRSGDSNRPETGLGLRYVLGHTGLNGVREARDIYTGSSDREILLRAQGDGSLLTMGQEVELDNLGGVNRVEILDSVEILEVRDTLGVLVNYVFETGVGGVLLGEGINYVRYRHLGPRFFWLEGGFSWGGDNWELHGGGSEEYLGVASGGDIKLGSRRGYLRLGSSPSDSESVRVEIGGADLPLVSEGDLDGYVFGGERGVVGDGEGRVRWADSSLGLGVYFERGDMEEGLCEVVVGDYLFPLVGSGEEVLLREGETGRYLKILRVVSEADLAALVVGSGEVGICDSGRIKRGAGVGGVRYLARRAVGVAGVLDSVAVVDGAVLPVRSGIGSSGLSYLPDGTGLAPTGVAPTGVVPDGSGLVLGLEGVGSSFIRVDNSRLLPIELVDAFPRRLLSDRAYVRRGDWVLRLNRSLTSGSLELIQALVCLKDSLGSVIRGEMIGLTDNSVKCFDRALNEDMGEVRELLFNFLSRVPRSDFGIQFQVGGDNLVEGSDLIYLFCDKKVEWVESASSSGRVEVVSPSLPLELGARVGSISLEVSQETDAGIVKEVLVEGVDFDLPLSGGVSVARLKASVGAQVSRGEVSTLVGGLVVDLGRDISGEISVGDWLVFGDNAYRLVDGVSGSEVTLSSVGSTLGSWKAYQGYSEPNPSLLNGEVFYPVSLGYEPLVKKVYSSLDLSLVRPDSSLFIRGGGQDIELRVLSSEQLTEYRLDLSERHVAGGSYQIQVGVDIFTEGAGFSVDGATGVITFDTPPSSSDIVLFTPLPLLSPTFAEVSVGGLGLASPVAFEALIEVLKDPQYESTSGAISFSDPLPSGVGVEVSYYPLTGGERGSLVTEPMGFSVVREVAVEVESGVYSFNAAGYPLLSGVDPIVFVGSELLGFGGSARADVRDNLIYLPSGVSGEVRISYSVTRAVGGERVVQTASSIFEASVELSENGSSFTAESDLTGDISLGSLIRLGDHSFFVSSIAYSGGVSTVGVNPPARFPVKSESLEVLSRGDIFQQLNGFEISAKPRANEYQVQGDIRGYVEKGSILVMGSEPHTVDNVELLEGGVTRVGVKGFISGSTAGNLLVSVRPVPLEGELEVKLSSAVIPEERRDLVRYSGGVGTVLSEGRDYGLNFETGVLNLRNGFRVERGVFYYLLHSSVTTLEPRVLKGGRVSYPTFSASYLVSKVPTKYLGRRLVLTGYFESPDQFYLRRVDEATYVNEVSSGILSRTTLLSNRGRGSKVPAVTNEQGRSFGFFDLLADDVVARNRIKLYDGVAGAQDDLLSTVTGAVVGDGDGSFNFLLELGGVYGGAGLEDPVTREIQPRYLALDLLPSGSTIDSELSLTDEQLASLIEGQRSLIENEMDDIALVGSRASVSYTALAPFISVTRVGVYQPLWKPSQLSRLYPESGRFMTTLYGDNPYLTEGRGDVIGQVENPAYGDFSLISSLVVSKRPARFRVWDYSPNGFDGIAGTAGKPTLLLSAVPFSDFPSQVDGSIDKTQFISEGGSVPDVVSGNIEREYRGLAVGAPLQLGVRGQGFSDIVDNNINNTASLDPESPFTSNPQPKKVRVREIIDGYAVTLGISDGAGGVAASSANIQAFGAALSISRGDTILESLGGDITEGLESALTYRVGVDIGLNTATGELLNIALPSISDPSFPFRETVGQILPVSGTSLGGEVSYSSSLSLPFEYPALKGDTLNDDGDESIPFFNRLSERDLLPLVTSGGARIIDTQHLGEYVYPDEIRGLGSANLGILLVDENLDPFSAGSVATVDARRGDLVVIDLDNSAATGIVEIGLVDTAFNFIQPPRFGSPISQGKLIQYLLEGAVVYRDASHVTGIKIEETLVAPNKYETLIQTSGYDLSDMWDSLYAQRNSLTGVLESPVGHEIKFHIYKENGTEYPAALFRLRVSSVAGATEIIDSQGNVTAVQLLISNYLGAATDILVETGTSWFNFASGVGMVGATETGYHDFSLDANSLSVGSRTASIGLDRLTFTENYPLQIKYIDDPIASELQVNNCEVTFSDLKGGANVGVYSDLNDTSRISSGVLKFSAHQAGFSVKVAALYGHDHTSVSFVGKKLSILTGSRVEEGDIICEGEGYVGGSTFSGNTPTDIFDGQVSFIGVGQITGGALDNVLADDLVHIESGHASGTHRVESVNLVGGDFEPSGELEVSGVSVFTFPRVVAVTDNNDNTYNIQTNIQIPTDQFISDGVGITVALVVDLNDLNLAAPSSDGSVIYGYAESINGDTFERFGFDPYVNGHNIADAKHNNGDAAFKNAISNNLFGGAIVSGQKRLPYSLISAGFDEEHLHFLRDWPAANSPAIKVTSSTVLGGNVTPYYFNIVGVNRNGSGVITSVEVDYITNPININLFYIPLLPNNQIQIAVTIPSGITLSPDFPRTNQDFSGGQANWFGTAANFGPPSLEDFTFTGGTFSTGIYGDEVPFQVRRLRRFTGLFNTLLGSLRGLGDCYFIREGLVSSLIDDGAGVYTLNATAVDIEVAADPAGSDTQVGDFPDVVSIGDRISLKDNSGAVTMKGRILSLTSGSLTFKMISGDPAGAHVGFTLMTRTHLIPELQSFQRFIDAASTEIMTSSTGNVAVVNTLTDANNDFSQDTFNGLSVAVGDYLIVDPQGALEGAGGPANPVEYGAPPQGDTSKVGSPNYAVGAPSNLDDNRGAYRVTAVDPSGDISVEPVFGPEGFAPSGYNILPTVNGAAGGDLRITSQADVNNSYAGDNNSVGDFTYRILRFDSSIQRGHVEATLFMRERTLSFAEGIKGLTGVAPYDWDTYVALNYVEYIGRGDRTHLSNSEITGIQGLTAITPYENSNTCLSILDRRFLIEDPKLEDESYGAVGAALPTLLDTTLSSAGVRENRYSWIKVRAGLQDGILPKADRIDFSAPNLSAAEDLDNE